MEDCVEVKPEVLTTLVSLGALTNLQCLPQNFPYPAIESASSFTKSINKDKEEE